MFHRSFALTTLLLAVGLVGCSGANAGDTTDDAGSDASASPEAAVVVPVVPRPVSEDVFTRNAIAYSGYRAGQRPGSANRVTEDQVREDLQLLLRGGWTFIRLFDSSDHAATVLKVIKDNAFDIKVMLGVGIAGPKRFVDPLNRDQIEKCVALAAQYGDIIAAVSVGNETLDDWSSVRTPPADLVGYIAEVRGRVSHPVTTDDMYIPFTFGTNGTTSYADVLQVAQSVDFLSIHAYAYIDAPFSWDWKQLGVPEGHARAVAMMNAAMAYTKMAIRNVQTAIAGRNLNLPIVIGEAGWKSRNTRPSDPDANFRAHPVNQRIFYDSLMSWVHGGDKDTASPKTAFYFEAFDEPWKTEDDGWGLFDVDRKAKYVLWSSFPDLKPAGAPDYSADDAVYYRVVPLDAGPADATGADGAARESGLEGVDAGTQE
jgi:exo-beta-1,3-glucanase (GH17 family)